MKKYNLAMGRAKAVAADGVTTVHDVCHSPESDHREARRASHQRRHVEGREAPGILGADV